MKLNKKTKLYLKLNLVSIFFVVVSFISVTLAWFVYSGLSTASTEVNVKAWYIELEKDGEVTSNNIVISLDDIYPGMQPIEEEIKISNLGDSYAQVKYEIVEARILGDEKDHYIINDTLPSETVEDKIAHEYPFHINIDLSKRFIVASGADFATFKVSISWPLDSGCEDCDERDSQWGTAAYKFKDAELDKKELDNSYQIRAAIKLDMKLTAEQYVKEDTTSDIDYRLGNEILYDVSLNKRCLKEGGTCLRTNVIDVNNTIGDDTVTLLPKVSKSSKTGTFDSVETKYKEQIENWTVESRVLNVKDVLRVISKDIKESVLVSPNASDLIIGNLSYGTRIDTVISNVKDATVVIDEVECNGYFKFLNKFTYFNNTECYWLADEFDANKGFAIAPFDESAMKIYGEPKVSECKVIPVIIAKKINLNAQI